MINNKGKLAVEILVMMIVIVTTSALVLIMIKTGMIVVRAEVTTEPILNTEFLPLGKAGSLAIKEFNFCSYVEDFNCLNEQNEFNRGDNIYIRFVVESTVDNGDVVVMHNYQVKNPSGGIVLEANQEDNFNFEMRSGNEFEPIVFSEYFNLGNGAQSGEYTLEMIVKNPMLNKKVVVTKKFKVIQ